jgi:hypothetical protein
MQARGEIDLERERHDFMDPPGVAGFASAAAGIPQSKQHRIQTIFPK